MLLNKDGRKMHLPGGVDGHSGGAAGIIFRQIYRASSMQKEQKHRPKKGQ